MVMTVHLKASVGGMNEKLCFESETYDLHDTIYELDAKQVLISLMETEFLLNIMKEFGFDMNDYKSTQKVIDFLKYLKDKKGLELNWNNSMTIDGKEYDYLNKRFFNSE